MTKKNPEQPIRTLIVDDHPVVRIGLQNVLSTQPNIEVVGTVHSGETAINMLQREAIDVVLLDLRMPGMSGIDTLVAIRRLPSPTRVIILSNFELDEEIYRAVEAGAKGYLLKDTPCENIVAAVHQVCAGGTFFPQRIVERLSERQLRSNISPRELEVLELLAKGLTNKEIASVLDISQYTVRNHINHISVKLEASDRTEAVMTAVHLGILTMPAN
jgi:two-component system, NarL family, response regulator